MGFRRIILGILLTLMIATNSCLAANYVPMYDHGICGKLWVDTDSISSVAYQGRDIVEYIVADTTSIEEIGTKRHESWIILLWVDRNTNETIDRYRITFWDGKGTKTRGDINNPRAWIYINDDFHAQITYPWLKASGLLP